MVESSKKDEIKAALDIVDVIGKSVNLTRQSRGNFTGATSSLSKSGASLHVDQHLQLWHDFSGRATPDGGDVFSWIAYEKGLDIENDFPEILRVAAGIAGIQIEELDTQQIEKIQKKQIIQELLTKAADVYHANLTPEIREYITKKWGISNTTIDRLKIGYAKPEEKGVQNTNLGKVADRGEWVETGLFVVQNYKKPDAQGHTQKAFEFFKGRVVFPYWQSGKVVNFAARGDFSKPVCTPDVKFEKNGETLIKYKKLLTHNERHPYVNECVNNGYIWGEDTIRGENYCIITEGIADAIVLMQNEYPVLSPVTTKFAGHDIEKLLAAAKKLKTVYICNDNEDSGAGEDGAIRTGLLLKQEGIEVKMILLPKENLDKMDVAEYFLRHTKEEFEEVKENSKDILVHLLSKVQLSVSSDSVTAKTENMKKAQEFIKTTLIKIQNEDEAKFFIYNNIKNYFPKFTEDDKKALLKVYKSSLYENNNKNPEKSGAPFDLDSESGRCHMTHTLTEEILQQKCIKFVAGSLRIYENGVYKADLENIKKLQREIVKVAAVKHKTPIMEKHTNSVLKMLEIMTAISQCECNTVKDEIAVGNGVLNLNTFELLPFTPEKVFFSKIPTDYIPNAPQPKFFLKLMEDAFKGNEEQYKVIQEVFGYCLLNNHKYQKLIYLLGDGGNGKGTILQVLTNLLGKENTSSATLLQLTDHHNVEYYLAGLHGKRANICGDVGSKRIENTENIKKLTSNTDVISARLPYGLPFDFINTAKLIFALNRMPDKAAFSTGDKRRDVIINFRNKVSETEGEIKDFAELIAQEGEMPGVLNWAIEGLKRLEENKDFSDKRTVAQRATEYDMKANPMKYFVRDCIEESYNLRIPNCILYEAYNNYRQKFGMPELGETELKRRLKAECFEVGINVNEKKVRIDDAMKANLKELRLPQEAIEKLGKQCHVFTGIGLIKEDPQQKLATAE